MIEEIDQTFGSFMADFLPDVSADSVDWYRQKLAFVGGIGAGLAAGVAASGASEETLNAPLDALGEAFSFCQFQIIVSQVPAEHRVVTPSGERGYTEAGTVHLLTLLEQANPADAARIRRTRYFLQKKFREGNGG